MITFLNPIMYNLYKFLYVLLLMMIEGRKCEEKRWICSNGNGRYDIIFKIWRRCLIIINNYINSKVLGCNLWWNEHNQKTKALDERIFGGKFWNFWCRMKKFNVVNSDKNIKLIWVESICDEPETVEKNIRKAKVNNPDYVGEEPDKVRIIKINRKWRDYLRLLKIFSKELIITK